MCVCNRCVIYIYVICMLYIYVYIIYPTSDLLPCSVGASLFSGVLRSPGQAPTSKRCTSAEKFSPAAARSPRPSSVARQPSCSRPDDRWDRWDGGSVLAAKDLGNIGKIGDVPI